jgi:exodeoxyribonuclease-5
VPTWVIRLRDRDGAEKIVHIPADDAAFQGVLSRIKEEAAITRIRWKHLHDFQSSLARLQSIYAMTVHTSQGSTHGTTFLDVPDIRLREKTNLLEMQQMLYVAATRPSERLILVGT